MNSFALFDVLFDIFLLLDYKTLFKCSLVCKLWNSIFNSESFWNSKLIILNHPNVLHGFKQTFKLHAKIKSSKFNFYSIPENIWNSHSKTSSILSVWPCISDYCYLVAHDTLRIFWVDLSSPLIIHASSILNLPSNIPIQSSLSGHTSPIALLLSNHQGTLISFDEDSFINIWNSHLLILENTIDTSPILENGILCTNIHNRTIVAGGRNSKIAIWDANTTALIYVLNLPSQSTHSIPLINVDIWNHFLCYSMESGIYVIYNTKSHKILHTFNIHSQQETNVDIINHENDTESQHSNQDTFFENSYSPLTLAQRSHFLLTNGNNKHSLAVWDTISGNLLYTLSESQALKQLNYSIPETRFIKFAEIASDCSFIFATSEFNNENVLLVWDFNSDLGKLSFDVKTLGDNMDMKCWIGYRKEPNAHENSIKYLKFLTGCLNDFSK